MLLNRVLKTPATNKGFSMGTLREIATTNEKVRQILGPHWQEVLSPTDKMAIDEVKALMNPKLIAILLQSEDIGNADSTTDYMFDR